MALLRKGVWDGVEETLADLRRIKDIRGLALVQRDGVLLAHDLADDGVAERVSAMAAAMVGTGELASLQLARGAFERTLVESEQGRILCVGAGERAILVGLLREDCNLGLVLVSVEQAAARLKDLLPEGEGVSEPPTPSEEGGRP